MIEHMAQQWATGQRVEHLGQVGMHARAFARGENDDIHEYRVGGRLNYKVVRRSAYVERKTELNMGSIRRFLTRIVAPMVLALALAGCTSTRLGYDWLPTLSMWQLNRYLSLDDAQRLMVGRRLDELHAWHRREQLPDYVRALQEWEQSLQSPVQAQTLALWRQRILIAWTPLAQQLAAPMAELALSLKPAQIDRLEARLADGSAELRDKYLPEDAARRIQARVDRWKKRMEFFLGDVSAEQLRALRRLAAEQPSDESSWMAEREARSRALVALLRRIEHERPAPALAQQWCAHYLDSLWASDDPARRARIEAANERTDQVSAFMISQASRAQRAHLIDKLRSYSSDFSLLAAR
jgi:hypothetical protein